MLPLLVAAAAACCPFVVSTLPQMLPILHTIDNLPCSFSLTPNLASVAVVWCVPILVQLPLFFNLCVLRAVHKLLTFDLNCPSPRHCAAPPTLHQCPCGSCCLASSLSLSLSAVCPLFVYRFNRPWIITRWLPWPQQVPLSFAHSTRSTPIATPPSPSAAGSVVTLLVFIIVNFLDETLICCPSKQRQNGTAKTLPNSGCPSAPFSLSLLPLLFLHLSTPGQVVNQFEFRMLVLLKSSHLFYSLQMRILQPSLRVLKVYTLVYIRLYVYACVFRIFRYACDIFSLILFSSRQRHLKCFLWILWRFMSGVSCA